MSRAVRHLRALLGLAWLLGATRGAALSSDARMPEQFCEPGPLPVGVRTLVLEDHARRDELTGTDRALVVEIWYPATRAARGLPTTTFAEFFGGYRAQAERVLRTDLDEVEKRYHPRAVRDAERAGGSARPLLIFSHGNGGFRHQNSLQMEHLASHGYLVASPDHTGNSRLSPLPGRPVLYDRKGRRRSALNRPGDVSFIIDELLARSQRPQSWLRGAVDGERIAVIGHSFGGYTACSVASQDSRVRAIVPMTVALAGVGVPPANVPTLIFVGLHDRTIGTLGNVMSQAYFLGCPADTFLVRIRRGGHFTFCDMAILDPDFGDGVGRGRGLDGRAMDFIEAPLARRIIFGYTLAFLDWALLGRPEAEQFLGGNHFPAEMDYRHHEGRKSTTAGVLEAR